MGTFFFFCNGNFLQRWKFLQKLLIGRGWSSVKERRPLGSAGSCKPTRFIFNTPSQTKRLCFVVGVFFLTRAGGKGNKFQKEKP